MVPQIQILTKDARQKKSSSLITVSKHAITIPVEDAHRIGLKDSDHIHLGVLGTQVYISKKPQGTFGGRVVRQYKDGNKFVVSVKPAHFNICEGTYVLGKAISQQIPNEQGNPVTITFFEMNPV